MDKPMNVLAFRGMALIFRIRDVFLSPDSILREVDIEKNAHILDYGCGPGSYSISAAEQARQGQVYALDIHPLATRCVEDRAARQGLTNLQTVLSDCDTGLPDESLDIVLLYDIFHMLSEPEQVLAELHRVLKTDGILSFSDHHMRANNIESRMTSSGLFRLLKAGDRTFKFCKCDSGN